MNEVICLPSSYSHDCGCCMEFQSGRTLSGQVFGWALVCAAFVNVTTGFCIPSFIYGLIFGKPTACNVR